MRHCLNREEMQTFLMMVARELKPFDDETQRIANLINDTKTWYSEIVCVNYLLSKLLEKNCFSMAKKQQYLEIIYFYYEQFFFEIQECNYKFIEFMYTHTNNQTMELDEQLLYLEYLFKDYKYGQIVRF